MMMRRFIVLSGLMTVISLFIASASPGENKLSELVEENGPAAVNWTDGELNAVGRGGAPELRHGDAQGRKLALASAVENARKKMLEAVKRIRIDDRGTVGDFAENNVAVLGELKNMVDKSEVVHQEFSTDGSVTVTVRMSMNGGFSQLLLPSKIVQIEQIKTNAVSSGSSGDGLAEESTGPYTGMIVDVRGISVVPCLAPRVCDETGREVFGAAYASREFAVQYGMTGYLSDLDAAERHPRVANRPLILKGLRTGGERGADIIVSNTDAARLRGAFENLSFLRRCRVLIVVDSPEEQKEG